MLVGLALIGYAALLLRVAGVRRTAWRLCSRLPWREVPAEVARAGVVSVSLDDRMVQLHLSLRQFDVLVREQGRVWLCGPGERGRAVVRLPGATTALLTRVRKGVPARPSGRRPGDVSLSLAGQALLSLPVGVLAFVPGWREDDLVAMVTGGVLLGAGLLALVALFHLARIRRLRKFASGRWQARRAFRLVSWSPGRHLHGPRVAEFERTDGTTAQLDVRKAPLDLIADIRAGAEVRIAGEGAKAVLGIVGHPAIVAAKTF